MENRLHSVCFTGHRSFPVERMGLLFSEIEKLIAKGYTDFYAGGAKGFDSRAAQCVLFLRRTQPDVRLHLILPCEPEQQTSGWSDKDKSLYDFILAQADEVTILSGEEDCMKQRNQALVDAASYCLCWCSDSLTRSGTMQTVRMAQRDGLEIQNIME